MIGRVLSATLLAAAVALAPVGVAVAQTDATTDDVAAALREARVYVDPAAEMALSDEEAADLRSAISDANTPIYVAVVPDAMADAAGGPDALVGDIATSVGLTGTYAVLAGTSFRAGSTFLRTGQAGQLAGAAFQEHRSEGASAVLLDFVERIGAAAARGGSGAPGGSSNSGSSNSTSDDGAGGGIPLGTILLVGGGAGLGVWAWRRSKRTKAEREERARAEAADRRMIQAELSVLADDVLRLEDDVLLHPAAREDYDAAVNRYRAAQAALEYADEPIDLVRVRRVLDEATYSMARVKAIVAGRTPPDPPAELRHPGRHGEPAIDLDDDRRPVYVGYGGPFQTGWFGGGGGGLFSGLLLGSMLGGFGPFGWGGGWGGTTVINEGDTYYGDGGFDGGGGFGDFGGGGFGDFGGSDFGDFGGGDFGGGDF